MPAHTPNFKDYLRLLSEIRVLRDMLKATVARQQYPDDPRARDSYEERYATQLRPMVTASYSNLVDEIAQDSPELAAELADPQEDEIR